MHLDVPTLTFAGGFVSLSSGLLVLLYWSQNRAIWAAFWWATATIGSAIGIFLLALHGIVAPFASDVIGPWILDVCAALTWVAATTFSRGFTDPYRLVASVAAWITTLAIVAAFGGEKSAAALGAGVSGCLYAAAAIRYWRGRAERLRGRWPMIFALSVFAIALFLASVSFLTSTRELPMPALNWLGIVHFAGLGYAIVGAICLVTMLKERSEAAYKVAALTDPLTGLANRRAFMDRAGRLLDRNAVDDKPVSVLAFDLDRFKGINDAFGHAVGDQVLRMFADVLSRTMRPADIAARIGGEEFVVMLPGCSTLAALAIADRIRGTFQDDALFVDGQRLGATVSVGVASSFARVLSLTSILANADSALYRAKASGRNRIMRAEEDENDLSFVNVIRMA
jgi:diguanylate cyclase (GGDEF)-like protein